MFRKRLLHARVFWALVVLSMALGGCGRVITEECDIMGKYYAPAYYEIVNKTKQEISVDHLYRDQTRGKTCIDADDAYPQNNSILPGSTYRGPLLDPPYDGWFGGREAVSFAPTTLIAIRLDQSTIAYYTGYPKSLSNELSSWLTANRSHLPSSFYNPMPTADNMDGYGLFYIVRNTGRKHLNLPTVDPDRGDIYTSLDPQNRPHSLPQFSGGRSDFLITFTVNGPKKSDVAISYKGTPRK